MTRTEEFMSSRLPVTARRPPVVARRRRGRRTTRRRRLRATVAVVNNGSAQRSMVDSLTVIFPSSVTLSSGAITLYNTTTSASQTISYSNPSSDGKTWLVTWSGSGIVGGSLPDGIYQLTVHHADVSGITLSSDAVFSFHRLFGDINGDGAVNGTDSAAFNLAYSSSSGSPAYDPAFDYSAAGTVNNTAAFQFSRRYGGATYTYTSAAPVLSGTSTTAPIGQTDISQWAGGANDMYYSGSNVIEERQSGSSGAWRQEVWGLGYVNSLIEQDTATAVDSGGVLPTSHFLQYALDTSFNSTGTLVTGSSGSYDSVAIQPSNSDIVVAGVSGSYLLVIRYNANGSLDTTFGSSGVAFSESSPTFAKLALDSSGNIDVAVNSGSNVEVYQLSDTGATNWSTTLTFATGVVPQGIALEPSGDIVVAGDSSSGTGIYLAGLNPSTGAVDTSFGSSGYVNAPLSGAPSGLSVALDSSGKILVAGSDSGDFSVVRFTSSGGLDTSFNSTGEAKVNLGGTDTAYAVAPGPGGTIVAAGVAVISGSNNAALIRLTSSGALDTSFNSTGKIVGSSGSGTIRAILVQTNGEVLAGGDASSGTAQKVWMFTPAGAADTAFASGGTLTANSGATVYGWAVASGPTQRIVVAGSYGGYEALAAFAPASLRLYAEQDANYNVSAMADPYGNVVQRFVYDSYGNMTVLSATWTPRSDLFNTQVGFQGMWLDAASGLYHTPNRDYSAALGRWMQADGGYWDGSNLYQAFDSSPTTLTDPSGLNPAALLIGPALDAAAVAGVAVAATYALYPPSRPSINGAAAALASYASNTASDALDGAANLAQSAADTAQPVNQAWGQAAETAPTADEVAAMNQWIADGVRDLLNYRGSMDGGASTPAFPPSMFRPPIAHPMAEQANDNAAPNEPAAVPADAPAHVGQGQVPPVSRDELPCDVQDRLQDIEAGTAEKLGPNDQTPHANREGNLPADDDYTEYYVTRDRGDGRRIIIGSRSGRVYYSNSHYNKPDNVTVEVEDPWMFND